MAVSDGTQHDIVTRRRGRRPAAEAARITETAERIERTESDIVAAAHSGSTLREARETFGYHTLQTRQP